MKMLTPPAALAWLSLASLLLLPADAVKAKCDCSNSLAADMVSFGVSALQSGAHAGEMSQKRPRDCTCITGVKTYQTTPRDELLGMGALALNRHLASCERKLDGLQEQKDYAVADSEVKVKKADEQMTEANKLLTHVKSSTAKDRSQAKSEKKESMKAIADLEKQVTVLNGQYDKEFSVWYELKDKMTVQVAKMKNCNCKKSLLLQQLRGPPSSPDMYKTAQKVDECETKVIKVSSDIEAAQKRGRDSTINAIEHQKVFGRGMADEQRMNKLLSTKGQADDLAKTKATLESIVKARQQKIDNYKATNSDIRKNVGELNTEMKKCGCA